MKLLLLRHAAAVPRGTPGSSDDDRPLAPQGEARFMVAARGLARIAGRPDVLLTSPLPRARQTADIVARAFGRIEVTIEPALAHGSVDDIVAALKRTPPDATVGLVGHEPLLGALLARWLGASSGEALTLKKGGAALVDLPDGPSAAGRLLWILEPRTLRVLAGRPHVLARVLGRVATTGIYLVRGVPLDLQRATRLRAAGEGTTLRWVPLQALRDYAARTWTPRVEGASTLTSR